eukprot:CAMPEP_0197023228 /NCGR_PEP_ID=MMETSP1384-20130603/3992_1 /TAXON_ID=29189 /ORGANISM="Ammonia sp." /LENGTH=367 /DNA_ID=CAMNT_0042451419 /DNA_START=28 /DNA_END=1131 /DNA_ORIENTATION=-
MSTDDHDEAPNPFSQGQYHEDERSGDSLKFESNFWKEEPIKHSGSAYDDEDAYRPMNDANNAYEDQSDGQKTNAITSLFNNMKSKLTEPKSHKDDANGAYGDSSWADVEEEEVKPSQSDGKGTSLLSTNQVTMTHEELNKREAYLDKREQQLLDKKKRLEAVSHELNTSNIRRDNWPCSYYPITFHSIQQEIPPQYRAHMKRMYALVLLTFLCYIANTFASLVLYFTGVETDGPILFAVIFLFCGVCGSWRLWYRQIYYALRDRKTIKWWVFFLFFFAHIGFGCYMVLGIEHGGAAGFITMVNAFQARKSFAGFVCLVCSCLWCIVTLGSCFYLKKSWTIFKARGGIEESRGELANAVAQHAAEQLV